MTNENSARSVASLAKTYLQYVDLLLSAGNYDKTSHYRANFYLGSFVTGVLSVKSKSASRRICPTRSAGALKNQPRSGNHTGSPSRRWRSSAASLQRTARRKDHVLTSFQVRFSFPEADERCFRHKLLRARPQLDYTI